MWRSRKWLLYKQINKKENITTFTFTEQQLRKQIDDIQIQLRSCVNKIHGEMKKQEKVLTQLISLLKGEMFKYQTTQKKEEERDNANHEKLVKKISYDIDQILQKHNEEIARISLLKEQASSRRSERVVYSNLFKKLQKEIKYYEEIYKEQLMKSETAKRKGPEEEKKYPPPIMQISKMVSLVEKQKKRNQPVNKSSIRQSGLGAYVGSTPFITAKDEETPNDHHDKRIKHGISVNERHQKLLNSWNPKQENTISNNTNEISKDINHYINFFEKIKIYTECSSAKEIIDHFSSLEEQSEELTREIEDLNESILECKYEEQKITKKIHQQEFAYRYTICLPSGPPQKQFLQRQQRNRIKSTSIKDMLRTLQQFSCILGVKLNLDIDEKVVPSEEQLMMLDRRVDMISVSEKNMSINRSKDETVMSENMVDCLLEKMDKFNDSERILDKNLFKQEYYKELNKGKRVIARLRK